MSVATPASRRTKGRRSWPDPAEGYAAYPAGRSHRERLLYLLQFAVFAPTFGETASVCFRLRDDAIDLIAKPRTRASMFALGAALHHLRVAFEAFGEDALVEEFPRGEGDADDAAAARITLSARVDADVHAQRLLVAAARRRETLAAFRPVRVPGTLVKALANECRRERTVMRVVVGDERDALASVLVPLVERAPLLEGTPLFLAVTTGGDAPSDWLAAGRALSAVQLRATAEGLATSQVDALVHDARLRASVATIVRTERTPQALVRVGFYDGPSVALPARVSLDDRIVP